MENKNDEALAARLDAAAALEREELAQAGEVQAAAGEEVVAEFFERTFSRGRDAAPTVRLSSRRRILLAAASVLALFALGRFWFAAEDPPREEVLLGGSQVECLQPVGEVESFEAFQWSGGLPPGGRYEITIWAESDGVRGELLVGPRKLAEPQWIPTEEKASTKERALQLSQGLRWRVRILDATGVEIDQVVVRAWRSR